MAHAQFIMRYFRRVECRFKQLKALGIMRDAERDSEAAVASLRSPALAALTTRDALKSIFVGGKHMTSVQAM